MWHKLTWIVVVCACCLVTVSCQSATPRNTRMPQSIGATWVEARGNGVVVWVVLVDSTGASTCTSGTLNVELAAPLYIMGRSEGQPASFDLVVHSREYRIRQSGCTATEIGHGMSGQKVFAYRVGPIRYRSMKSSFEHVAFRTITNPDSQVDLSLEGLEDFSVYVTFKPKGGRWALGARAPAGSGIGEWVPDLIVR